MKIYILSFFIALSSIIKAQQECEFLQSILIDQNANEVILGSNQSDSSLNFSWAYFNQDGNCIGGDAGIYDTISDLNQQEYLVIWQLVNIDSLNCTSIDTLLFENNQWMLAAGQINEVGQGCTDSLGVTYNIGSQMFLNDCEYIMCEQNNQWSDTMVIDECLTINCIAGVCIDVSNLGQQGTYQSQEECQSECGEANDLPFECIFDACVEVGLFGQEGSYATQEECLENCSQSLPFECILGNCVDIGQFDQDGSYATEKQCLENCESVKTDPSFECIAGTCVDIGQFGQEGSYDSMEECEKSCQANEQSSYECVADNCVDVGQFGQEGSFDNLQDCQIMCEGLPANINQFSNGILIAPNPFNSYTQIYSTISVRNYNLFDMNGRKISSQQTNSKNFVLDRKELLPGIYFLELIFDNKQIFEKIIVK